MRRIVLPLLLLAFTVNARADFWCTVLKLNCEKPSWVPGYETVVIRNSTSYPDNPTYPTNPFYFADSPTTNKLRDMFMAAYSIDRPCTIVQAPGSCSAPQRFLAFQNRYGELVFVVAGLLAANYTNNPDGKFPNVAFNATRTALEAVNINTTLILPPKEAAKVAKRAIKAMKKRQKQLAKQPVP